MLPLSFLALWASGFASEGPTIDRAASLGLSRVPSADGISYVYDLPDGVETPAYQTIGALRWKYDGQARFGQTSGPASGLGVWVHPDRVLTDVSYDAAAYLGVGETIRLDKYGRRWVLAAYDEQALWRKLQAYDDLVEREFGSETENVVRQDCPNGCTSSGGAHYITAITHGHAPMGVNMYTSGAKARDFRDWVIAHM